MAAAEYYMEVANEEERLNTQAQHVAQRTLLFQAQSRGFLIRNRLRGVFRRWDSVKKHDFPNEVFYERRDTKTEQISIHKTTNYEHDIPKYSLYPLISREDLQTQRPEPVETLTNHRRGKLWQTMKTTYINTDEAVFAKAAVTTSTEATLESAAYSYGEAAPWWINTPVESENGQLCTVCRHIDFDALLHTTDALEDDIPLGTLQAIAMKTECSFCRLVAHTGFYTLKSAVDPLEYNVYCELCGDITWNRYVTRIRNICLKLTVIMPDPDQSWVKYGWMQQILSSNERLPEQGQNDSRIIKTQINLELIKRWIETCKERHTSTYLESRMYDMSFIPDQPTDIHDRSALIHESCEAILAGTVTFSLTLVDVKMECLDEMPSNTKYIALSYVWGGVKSFQNVMKRRKDLYVSHSISVANEAIPLTIRDAIQLVRDLGERYLWVDSLCICQDNLEDKRTQITNMGKIYRQALLTIVAATGSDANAGLPGVQARPRKIAQRAEYVQNMVLVNELCQLEDIIEPSYWNTRGWTYQEAQLSKRCIIICKTHIFFRCNQVVHKEDSGTRNVAVRGDRASKIRAERQPIWRSYQKAVAEYTKRSLSDDSDAVYAFQGIADLLQAAFKGDFLFGLPETELDIALLWQPASLIRRRVHPKTQKPLFPSWSWTGWIGEVKYSWTKHQLDDNSMVEWQCMDLEKESIRFCTSDELRSPNGIDHHRWHYVPNEKGPPHYYHPDEPDIWCLHPVAEKEERRNFRLIQPGSHVLIFRAYTAVFRISLTSCTSLGEPLDDRIGFTHSLAIFGSDGFIAGRVLMPRQLIGKLKSPYQEFVCLSRRRRNLSDNSPVPKDEFKAVPNQVTLYPCNYSLDAIEAEFDPRRYNLGMPWCLFNVMMIARDGDFAERVALGLMHVTAFWQAVPMRKVIRLA